MTDGIIGCLGFLDAGHGEDFDRDCPISLVADAYGLPAGTDRTEAGEDGLAFVSLCDPYSGLVELSERMAPGPERTLVETLHSYGRPGGFVNDQPVNLQAAVQGLDGLGRQRLDKLERVIEHAMRNHGIDLEFTRMRDGGVLMTLSRTVDGARYCAHVSSRVSVASRSTPDSFQKIECWEAFDRVLPTLGWGQRLPARPEV